VTKRIAFECYADADLVHFLRTQGQLDLRPFHAYGQGEVVKSVIVRGDRELGIVDEDPLATHHRDRDNTELVDATDSVELRRRGDRHLLVIKPDLERCFLKSMKLVGLESRLPQSFPDLHAALNVDRSLKHEIFRKELTALHEASRSRKQKTLVTDILDLICRVM